MKPPVIEHDCNLLPLEFRYQSQVRWVSASLIFFALLLLSPLVWIPLLQSYADSLGQSSDTTLIDQLRTERDRLRQEVTGVTAALDQHQIWSDLLIVIGKSTKDKVWLKEVQFNGQANNIKIEGLSHNSLLVSEFISELERSAYFEKFEFSLEPSDKKQITFNMAAGLTHP